MRLTKNNIKFVNKYYINGTAYSWVVGLKSTNVSDMRTYINYDKNGKTVAQEYPEEWLPKTVRAFLSETHPEVLHDNVYDNGDHFVVFCYK